MVVRLCVLEGLRLTGGTEFIHLFILEMFMYCFISLLEFLLSD